MIPKETAQILKESEQIYQEYLTKLHELKQKQNQVIIGLIQKLEEKKLAQLRSNLKK